MASPHVVNVSDAEFMSVVVEGSKDRPVLVDFWAEWCGPCKQLAPVLERLVDELDGRVLLAKVDVDAHPMVAGQLGVQSIPAVFLFVGQRPVDRFMGALPREEILRFLEPYLPAEVEPEASSELDQAERALKAGDRELAQALIEKVEPGGPHEARRVAVVGRLGLLELIDEAESAEAEEGEPSAGRLERYRGALARARDDLFEDALESLLELVAEDKRWHAEAPRRAMLRIFEIAGIRSPLSDAYRDRLARLLY